MFGLSLLRRIPPNLFAWIIYAVAPVQLLLKYLVGTVYGAFLFSVLLYWAMSIAGESKPFTSDELLIWIDGLDNDTKTAIATSVITILGFLVAFHTATHNWKAQAVTNLKINIAAGIGLFYGEALGLVVDAKIHAQSLLDAANLIKTEGATTRAAFRVERALELNSRFLEKRERLSAMAVEVHSILGRDYSLLATIWGATKALEDCASAFSEITQKMWVPIPSIQANFPNPLEQFVRQVDVQQYSEFIECCERNYGFISSTMGGVRGSLLAPLIGLNLPGLLNFFERRTKIVEAISKTQKH